MPKSVILLLAVAIATCFLLLFFAISAKAGSPVVAIDNLGVGDLVIRGFELEEKSSVDIVAVGAGTRYIKSLHAYGWILDAESREVVWSMQDDCFDSERLSSRLIECQSTIKLHPGKYEVYYYVGRFPNLYYGDMAISVDDLGDLLAIVGDLFSGELSDKDAKEDWDRFEKEDLDELMLSVRTDDQAASYTPKFAEPEGSIVYFNLPEMDEMHEQGFTLKKETELFIYAIGEYSESYDVFVDGGWIVNADTHEKVWAMDEWNTEHAGGASKNRYFRDKIRLPAGNYIAHFSTDNSHDPGEWNSPPPADLLNYGMTIAVADIGDLGTVAAYATRSQKETVIVSLDRMRNDDYERAGFTLKKETPIRILAVGERGYSDDELVDYGWIIDAEDLENVWEMTPENTVHAGGAAKNCMFDGVITLPAGNYIVHYRTDDSHAYSEWNASPPFYKKEWGITLYGVGDDFDESDFDLVDEFEPTGNVLVSLIGLGDDEDVSKMFTIDESARVRIVALGEGRSNRMFDYGWIENDKTGETIWEMTYRKTRHGGGADKNREAVANITLEPGTYTAYFVTDDSHSIERFNASPPDNPERWGMIITKR